ncbi:MAG TPA: type II secretion system protein GspN [Candidatus Binataceae bacterium]|nr:type II secretion system protein GspN [Candidatus Binataceae bacterium]
MRRPAVIVVLVAGALLTFAAFLIADFPYDDMASTMLAPYRLKLNYRAQHIHLPIGVALDGVDLVSIASSPSQLLLQSPNVALRPTLGSLLLGRPGLGLDAEVYRGTLHATVEQEAGAIGVTFDARALSLDDSQLLSQFGTLLGGTLSAGGSARIHGPMLTDNTGRATIDGHDVTVEITHGFPLIHLGTISGQILLENGVLSFQDLETHGGDVESKADGAIQLGADPADSTITARVYLTPTPSGRAHFGLLFHMLPHPPSEGPYEVRGPLLSPSVS